MSTIEKVRKGDCVALTEFLEVFEKKDAENNLYCEATIAWSLQKTQQKPYEIFGTTHGIYVGMKYVPIRQPRRGVVQVAMHGFFFGDREVFIDPKYITVIARFSDSIKE